MEDRYFDIEKKYENEKKAISLKLVDNENRDMEIHMKWDGCIDIFKYCNGDTIDKCDNQDNVDYMHICDVQEFINRLQEVVDVAKENFSKEDFSEYWE